MEASLGNDQQCLFCTLNFGGVSVVQQRSEIDPILGSPLIIAGQNLQSQEVPEPRDRNRQALDKLDGLRLATNFGLDPRRAKEQIHHDARVVPAG